VTEPTKMPSPPNPDHPEFENEMKCLASLSASGTPLRLFVLADSPVTPGAGGSAPSAEPSPTAQILLEDKVSAALSAGPKVDFLRLGAASDTSAGAPPDAAAIKGKAAEIGATHCLIVRTRVSGAFSETVSRLLDASTGLELAHDVVWRANSEGVEAVFVNGARMR